MENLVLHIEALIFASSLSISTLEIKHVLDSLDEQVIELTDISEAVDEIRQKYQQAQFAIELVEINGGFQFLTKKDFYSVINQLQVQRSKKKLSQAALETLAIVAYRQPITKLEIEQIRGVNCDYTIQKLLDKELITISGKAESVGKPLLYSSSSLFMDHFGIKDSTELPQLNDIQLDENTIGEKQD